MLALCLVIAVFLACGLAWNPGGGDWNPVPDHNPIGGKPGQAISSTAENVQSVLNKPGQDNLMELGQNYATAVVGGNLGGALFSQVAPLGPQVGNTLGGSPVDSFVNNPAGATAGATANLTIQEAMKPPVPDPFEDPTPGIQRDLGKLNALFGIGDGATAQANRNATDSAFGRYKQRFVDSMTRRVYDSYQGASGTNAQAVARSGLEGSSVDHRQGLTNATELGQGVADVQRGADDLERTTRDNREQTRQKLAQLVVDGAGFDSVTAGLTNDLKRNDSMLQNAKLQQVGNLFSTLGDAAYTDQAARRRGGQGVFGSSDPVGSLFG